MRRLIWLAMLGACIHESGHPPPPYYVYVTVGDGFSCAGIADSPTGERFRCWGDNIAATHPSASIFGDLQSAGRHTCAMDGSRGVQCWGDASDPTVSPVPSVSTPVLSVSPTHACVLHVATEPRCWGAPPGAAVPPLVDTHAFAIAAGSGHTCMLDFATHKPLCWGRDELGQSSPPAIELLQIVAGDGYSCGVSPMGERTCWGRVLANAPPSTKRLVTLVAGPTTVCGLDGAGFATCWGDGPMGLASPPAIAFQSIALGSTHACGVTLQLDEEDAALPRVECWGDNTHGQLDAPVLE